MKLSVFLATMLLPGLSSGALVFTATKINNITVQVVGSGSFNTTGLTAVGPVGVYPQVNPSPPGIVIGPGSEPPYSAFFFSGSISGPSSIGLGQLEFGNGSGDLFGFLLGGTPGVYLPVGYVSGSALSATGQFIGFKVDGLQLTAGTYVWTLPNDTITLTVVPEPSTALILLPAAGLLFRRRRVLPASNSAPL